MNDVIAIIPARSGSKSIKDKNIQLLSGHPLIAYSIAAAKLSKKINRVIVSTNSKEYAYIAEEYGAEVPFIRPHKFATDASTDKDFLLHAIEWFSSIESLIPEYWVHLRPTTPLRSPEVLDKAIDQIKNNRYSTSLRSGHKAPESPWKWFIKDGDFFKGLLQNEDFNLPKEAFNQVYIPDGYIDILKASYVQNNSTIHGERMISFESPVCTEVDSKEEFEFLKYQIEAHGSLLFEYLEKIKNKNIV